MFSKGAVRYVFVSKALSWAFLGPPLALTDPKKKMLILNCQTLFIPYSTMPGTALGKGERINLIRPYTNETGIKSNITRHETIDIGEVILTMGSRLQPGKKLKELLDRELCHENQLISRRIVRRTTHAVIKKGTV